MKTKEILSEIFKVLLGVAIGGIFTYFYSDYVNKVQELKYYVEKSENILRNLATMEQDAKLTIGERSTKTFSLISFNIFNTTSKDYSDVPINILLTSDSNIPPQTLSIDYSDQNGFKEAVYIEEVGSNSMRYKFIIKSATRNNDNPVLSVKFAIAGEILPKYTLSSEVAGLQIQEAELKNIFQVREKNLYYIAFAIGLTILLIVIGITRRIANERTQENIENVINSIKNSTVAYSDIHYLKEEIAKLSEELKEKTLLKNDEYKFINAIDYSITIYEQTNQVTDLLIILREVKKFLISFQASPDYHPKEFGQLALRISMIRTRNEEVQQLKDDIMKIYQERPI